MIIFLQFKRFLSTFELHSTLSIVVIAFVGILGFILLASGYVEFYDTRSIQLEDKSPVDFIMPILTGSYRFYRI